MPDLTYLDFEGGEAGTVGLTAISLPALPSLLRNWIKQTGDNIQPLILGRSSTGGRAPQVHRAVGITARALRV